jgi:hypothetical protein
MLFLACVAFSLLPDADFLPAVLAGTGKGFHNYYSHSLLIGLLLAAVISGAIRISGRAGARTWFYIILAGYSSHVIMDAFTWGRGVMIFWPVTTWRLYSPVLLFHGLRWSQGWVSREHLVTLFNEMIFVLLIILSAHILTRFMRNRQTRS